MIYYVAFKRFVPSAPFLCPLKTSENRKGEEKACIENKWANFAKTNHYRYLAR